MNGTSEKKTPPYSHSSDWIWIPRKSEYILCIGIFGLILLKLWKQKVYLPRMYRSSRSRIKLTPYRIGIILITLSLIWGLYLMKIQIDERASQPEYLKARIIQLSKQYIQALAHAKTIDSIDGTMPNSKLFQILRVNFVVYHSHAYLRSCTGFVIFNFFEKVSLVISLYLKLFLNIPLSNYMIYIVQSVFDKVLIHITSDTIL